MPTCTAEEHLLLGALVLGGLSAADATACREHLRRCPACGDELATFADLPGLLERLAGPGQGRGYRARPAPPEGT